MIRALLKGFIYLCLLLLAGVVALILAKDTLIRNLTERQIINQTGLYVRIDRMHVGFRSPVISIENLKLYNRPEFGGGLLIHLNELHVECDPEALKTGELHLQQCRLDVETLNIVRNPTGQTNLNDFIRRAGTIGLPALASRQPSRSFGFTGIDELTLSLGRIRFIDQQQPHRSREAVFGVSNQRIHNIRNTEDLYGVAGLVLHRSGMLNPQLPTTPPPSETRLLQTGWNWVMDTLGLTSPSLARPEPTKPH